MDGVPTVQVVAAVMPAAVQSGVPVATVTADILLGAVSAGAPAAPTGAILIVTGFRHGFLDRDVGTGLGIAAAQLSASDPSGAAALANMVANEGTGPMEEAFAAAVLANGGSEAIASAATANPNVEGGWPPVGSRDSHPWGGENLFIIPLCSNPSCS
jgi:hypothetical protein